MRILLADDQARVRYALRALLAIHEDIEIVAEATDVAELLDQAQRSCPDLILVDWELPGLAMSAVLPVLHRVCHSVRVVVLSGLPEAKAAAFAAGADRFVSKSQPPERLLEAIYANGTQVHLQGMAER